MLCLKKVYRDELLQLAILLSLLRVDRRSSFGYDYDVPAIGVGIDDIQGWDRSHSLVRRDIQIHPKNLDSVLLNYEQQVFDDLNSLGRYNRINSLQDVTAYLLNIDENNDNNDTDSGNNSQVYDRTENISRTSEGDLASGVDVGDVDIKLEPEDSEQDDPFSGGLFGAEGIFLQEEEEYHNLYFLDSLAAVDVKEEPQPSDELTQEVRLFLLFV
ncbi:hypothetical protein J6590_018001 [Homalodisca vitripennis]|nr:hypothetical protein J6590_018001 [Homalodisca vitripennis]